MNLPPRLLCIVLVWTYYVDRATAARPFSSPTTAEQEHWAFQPLNPGSLPAAPDGSWPRTGVDQYILAKLTTAGQTPNAPASRRHLIRRLTYDLTGLPPATAAVADFLADADPHAYDKLIDRLLASPQYGEHWGRHWLDVVRYADSNDLRAIGARHDITETYRYRDWAVRALNGDMPYNRFMMDQVAGDLFPSDDPSSVNCDGILATGMLAFGSWGPGDSDGEKMHSDMVDDMINVTTRAFLGLTVACARCHDHKFDPITQADYYALAGIFFSTEIAPPGTSAPWVQIPLVTDQVIEEYNHRENVRKEAAQIKKKQLEEFREETYQSLLTTYIPETSRYLDAAFRYLRRPPGEQALTAEEFARRQGISPAPQSGRILFMVNTPDEIRSGDLAMADHLRARGHQVTYFAPAGSSGSQQLTAAMQHDVVLISESIAASSVVFTGEKSLQNVPRPIISYEPYMYHNAGWTEKRTHVNFGLTGVGTVAELGLDRLQHSLFVHPNRHSLTLGLSGNIRVYDEAYTLAWGRPSPSAVVIASVDAASEYPVIFIYETGSLLADGTQAQAPRIGLFLGQQAIGNPLAANPLNWGNLTFAGKALVNATIEYSINPERVSQPEHQQLVNRASQQRPLRSDALLQWIDFVHTPPAAPTLAALDQFEPKAWSRKGLYRWHAGAPTPYALMNATDQHFDVPSIVANTYYGRIIHTEGPAVAGPEHFQGQKIYLGTDEAAPTNGIISLLFRAPDDGRYDFAVQLTNCVDAEPARDPFYHVVINEKLQTQGRLRGYGGTATLSFPQIDLKAGDAFEICAAGGGVTFPQAIMETDVLVTRGSDSWNAAREFHSPNPGSPIVNAANPLAGHSWEYGYRIMQSELTDDWVTMNPSLFRHLTLASERGTDSHGAQGSGPDLNCWSTPAYGRLNSQGLALHPGATSGVAVEWRSPVAGSIQVSGTIYDLQGIGDGVLWKLEYQPDATPLVIATGVLQDGTTATLHNAQKRNGPLELTVRVGDMLRLRLDPQANAVADTTGVEWTIHEMAGQEREWNLVDDLIAACAADGIFRETTWRLVNTDPTKAVNALSTQNHTAQKDGSADFAIPPATPDILRTFTAWLSRFGGQDQAPPQQAEDIYQAIHGVQLQLNQLVTQLAENPKRRVDSILSSPIRRLYIALLDETGPFRFVERDDKTLLPPTALLEIQRLLTEQNSLKNNATPMYPVTMGTREGGARMTKYKGFHDAQIHEGGHYAHLGKVVPRGFPKFLAGPRHPAIPQNSSGRKQLALWLADPLNPLPARVMVNRIWLYHFGAALVRTPGDFGLLGEPPTHPQLLDYLAQQLLDSDWSIKHIHRQILLSSTYRQSTDVNPSQLSHDPNNRLWSRMNVRRLQAEAIRDTLLAVSQRLDQRIGGPVLRKQEPDADAMMTRRALYLMTNRSDKSGFRFLFDAADPENVVDQRNVSTVALQALFLLNHPFVLELLPLLGAQASHGLTPDASEQELTSSIQRLYETLFARQATLQEVHLGIAMLRKNREGSADFTEAWQQYCQVLLCANELIYLN